MGYKKKFFRLDFNHLHQTLARRIRRVEMMLQDWAWADGHRPVIPGERTTIEDQYGVVCYEESTKQLFIHSQGPAKATMEGKHKVTSHGMCWRRPVQTMSFNGNQFPGIYRLLNEGECLRKDDLIRKPYQDFPSFIDPRDVRGSVGRKAEDGRYFWRKYAVPVPSHLIPEPPGADILELVEWMLERPKDRTRTSAPISVPIKSTDQYATHRRWLEVQGHEPRLSLDQRHALVAHQAALDVRRDGSHLPVTVELQAPYDWEGEALDTDTPSQAGWSRLFATLGSPR